MAYTAMASLLNKLTAVLLEERNLFQEVKDRVWFLVCMLKRLRPLVMELQRKPSTEIAALMKELIGLVSDADHSIDSYITTTRQLEFFSVRSKDDEDVKFTSEIERTTSKLKIWQNLCFNCIDSLSVDEPDKDDDKEVVGLENEVTMMIERLKNDDPQRDVIPIVGSGGVGKTTLARRVYDHPTIVEKFPCRAWIYAHNYNELSMKKLLPEIFNQLKVPKFSTATATEATEDNAAPRLEKMIILRDLAIQTTKHLKTNRYLLVFDDVFRTQFWADINIIFPDYKRGGGGRIIFTTRYNEVALHARPRSPPFHLPPPLNEEESWILFSKRVASASSRDKDEASSSHGGALVESQKPEPVHDHPWKERVDACGGLPLAIVALASHHQSHLKLQQGPVVKEDDQIFLKGGIWELIYSNLPHHLKPCLIYLAVLKSCRSTQFKELIIVEGLVQLPKTMTRMIRSQNRVASVEDYDIIAEEYLNELIKRKLVEVVNEHWHGSIREIAIPKQLQLMDFCRLKAKEEILLEFAVGGSTFPWLSNRIAVERWNGNYREFFKSSGIPRLKAHTILILKETATSTTTTTSERKFDQQDWVSLLQSASSVRVLDIGVDFISILPLEIDKLTHLSYLRLNFYDMDASFPASICYLWNLQFLRVKNNRPLWLPSEFWKMRKLSSLSCSDVLFLPPPPGNSVLHNLQRIKHLSIQCCTEYLLSRMPNLVRLGMGRPVQRMDNESPEQKVCRLWWDVVPPNITHLTLKRTRLLAYPMSIMGPSLPKLEVLKLASDAIEGDDFHLSAADGFYWLKSLKLEKMEIKRWNLSVGAIPNLEILVIRDCCALQDLPSKALQNIRTLRELKVYNYSHEAVKTSASAIQERVGKDQLDLLLERKSD